MNFWNKIRTKDELNNDIKEIITTNRLLNEERTNQFHIYVQSQWERIHNCKKCFPDNLLDEKPLYEADKSLLTPDFIYELPKSAEKKIYNETYFSLNKGVNLKEIENPHISEEMLKYGHFRGKNKHFFYYIKYPTFFKSNEALIVKWTKIIKANYFDSTINENDRILLIIPDKSTSGHFAFTINKYVFNESCNIISFNPHEENISNFEKFFSNWLFNAGEIKTHIFYVDNLLAKGNSALAVHDAVKLVRQKNHPGEDINMPGLAGVFTMINRLDIYDFENIKRKIRRINNKKHNDIFSFSSLNFPVIQTITDEKGKETGCYLCNSLENYKLLAKECSLDNIRQYITEKNLSKREIRSKYEESGTNNTDELREMLRMKRLCISHFLFQSFNDSSINDYFTRNYNENDFCRFRIVFRNNFLKDYGSDLINDFELKCILIKVLSEPPFIIYLKIKKTIFRWILHETHKTLNKISKKIENREYSVDELHYLRLLIKKGSQINVNYIISSESILQLLKLSAFEDILKRDLKTFNNSKLQRFLNFRFLVISSIKESLYNNEPKAIKLEETLTDTEIIEKSKINTFSKRLYESLILENTGVIRQAFKASEYLFENTKFEYSKKEPKILNESVLESTLNRFLKKGDNKIENINRFIFAPELIIDGFSKIKARPFIYSLSLYRYLKILSSAIPDKNENISESSEYLLSQLCKILDIDTSFGGAFLLLKYQNIGDNGYDNRNLHVISKYGEKAKSLVEKLEESNNSFSKEFLKGYEFKIESLDNNNKYFWTVIGALKSGNVWRFQEHQQDIPINPTNFFSEFEHGADFNRFYFIRICKWLDNSKNKNKSIIIPQAVIAFFDNREIEFKPQNTRYALSLRNEISDFISNNFENDAFKSWIESEKRIEEYVKRYVKNTHGVYKRLNKLTNFAYENPNLFAVYSDIFIGQIHYSLLVKKKITYQPEIKDLNELFDDDYIKLIKGFFKVNSFNESNISLDTNSFKNKEIYYNRFTKFIFFQLLNNISSYTIKNKRIEAIVSIYVIDDYIVVENTKSKITDTEIERINNILQNKIIPLESISLYVINQFCINMCRNPRINLSIIVNKKDEDTFIVKLPLIV